MTRDQKNQEIDAIVALLNETPNIFLADIHGLKALHNNELRRICFQKNIQLRVVKNSLLKKALERVGTTEYSGIFPSLKGATAVMFSTSINEPAKVIKAYLDKNKKFEFPQFKGAVIDGSVYVGDNKMLDTMVALKSKEDLLGDIIGLLQSPAKNVISALKSGGQTIAGLVKTLQERPE